MRIQLILSANLALSALLCCADITLTDTNGVAATGQIITYSPNSGLVNLRQDGSTRSLPLASLSPESRQQVVHWRSDKNFNSRSSLNVSFREENTQSSSNITGTVTDSRTGKKLERTIGYEDHQFCKYNFRVTNTSDTPFKDLVADYRIFFTQQLTEEYTGKYQLAGTAERDQLTKGRTWGFSSTNFLTGITYRMAPGINWVGMPHSSFSRIEGAVLCLRKRGLNGEWIVREIEYGDPPRKRDRTDYQKVYK